MLAKLAALFSNGQVTAAVVALVDATFGLLVATGVIAHAPDNALVASIVAITFTAAGIVLAYIQHSQHAANVAYVNRASLLSLQMHLQAGGRNPVSAALDPAEVSEEPAAAA
jgi:hypothetical protein